MSNINKQALLIENGQLVADTLRHLANNEIDSDYFAIVSESENGTEIEQELAITDYAMQAAGTVGELVKALESAQELVELQRFKLERQAEDLYQAKSLESIHRDKRFEVEREFSSYKDSTERNKSRLAQEVCDLEDKLEAAEKRIAELELRLSQQQSIAANNLDMFRRADARVSELEAREVKMPELKMLRHYLAEVTHREREDILLGVKLEFHRALQAAGIITKVGE